MNPHNITKEFEKQLCRYTGAPYCVAVDNCSNALFLALHYELHVKKDYSYEFSKANHKPRIFIPRHTYPSVACEIIHAGGKINWIDNIKEQSIEGAYFLGGTNIVDSALSFTSNMYKNWTGNHVCLSFTGPFKHLKLGKGGAILTDDWSAYLWFKRARFSGRQECSYHIDDFDQQIIKVDSHNIYGYFNIPPIAGWNFYMMPEIAARGLLLLQQFYDIDGNPKKNEDLCLRYPDISKFKIFNQ